ncbi:hypothetical protein QYF36_010111 [Acer negundo]|nr:hypothetical protein QYF36_010111 [Acer negundo]
MHRWISMHSISLAYLWQAMVEKLGHDHVDTDLDNNIDGYYTLLQSEGIRSSDNVTPFAEAGFFSTMSFWWLNPLVKKGKEKILENEDIPELRSADQAQTCYSIYMEQMNKWKQKGSSDSPSMLLVILFCQRKAILVSGLFAFIKVLALSSSPLFLIAFIKVASGKESFQYEAYALTGGLFLVKCLESLSGRQWYFQTRLIGLQEYVMGALSGKTVLLVTHQVDFLPAFDLILLMAGGKILDASIYDKLLDSTPEFQDLVNANKNTAGSKRHFEFASSTSLEGEITETNVGKQLKTPSGDQLIKKEERETGDTGLKPYLQYLSHNKSFLYFFLQFVLHMLFVIAQMIQSYWFAAEIQNSLVSRVKLFTIYSVIGCVLPVLLLLRSFSIVVLGKLTSESIFSTLLISLFRAPMSFHDSTPLGRILSRVSSDMSIVDTELAFHLSQAVGSDLNAYSCLLLLGILAWPVLIIIIPMIYFSILLQRYYFASAKELMRMNGTTKSSIASHLAESIVGATTIRAFGQEDGFFSKHLKLIDANACQYFHSSSADEWLVQRLEILCAIVLSSSALAMTLLPLGSSASGFIGMALSYGLSLNVFLIFAVQSHCSAANFIVSVERLEQYMHIPDEAKTIAESRQPEDNWPATGKVEITNLKYTDHEIWEVLEKCHLREVIREKEEGLDSLGILVSQCKFQHLGRRLVLIKNTIIVQMVIDAYLHSKSLNYGGKSNLQIGLKELSLALEFEEEIRYKQIIYEEEIKTLKKLSVQNRLLQ